ncbi:MAG: alpha/beta fold hydrolase [Cyclobacteriaceae bacterium]|nr:alpha/beta fold hydrolase [Cyclobacteriaceae bacterium]
MSTSKLTIKNSNGEQLHATLELPANKKPVQFAIFAHCFTCSSDLGVVRNISRELTNFGFGVLRFDFTGLGSSEGDFADTNFSHNLKDLRIVNDYLKENYDAPMLLVGHSLGGAAVLIAALQLDNIKAVATIAAPSDPEHVKHLLAHGMDEMALKGEARVSIGGRSFMIKKQFLEDLEKHSLSTVLNKLRKPILILHAPQDSIVGINNAAEIYQSAHHPKSFVSLDGADHLLSDKRDSLYAAKTIGTWAERYLLEDDSVKNRVIDTKGEQVAVHWKSKDIFTTQISNNRHAITADEPVDAGGADLGFSPYELLNAALGACTAMTLKLYAERKKWPLEEVYVYLTHDKRHVDDCEECADRKAKIDHIKKRLEFVGDLSEEQKMRLAEIAALCPVHKTLTSATKIETNY